MHKDFGKACPAINLMQPLVFGAFCTIIDE